MAMAAPTVISTPEDSRRSLFSDGTAVIWAIALAKFVFHIYSTNATVNSATSSTTCPAATTCSGVMSTSPH